LKRRTEVNLAGAPAASGGNASSRIAIISDAQQIRSLRGILRSVDSPHPSEEKKEKKKRNKIPKGKDRDKE
jgi:hypothetical protein